MSSSSWPLQSAPCDGFKQCPHSCMPPWTCPALHPPESASLLSMDCMQCCSISLLLLLRPLCHQGPVLQPCLPQPPAHSSTHATWGDVMGCAADAHFGALLRVSTCECVLLIWANL